MSWQADLEAHMVQGPLHGQAAWDIRSSPRMYRAFTQLWGTERLFVHVAGFNLKPPVSSLHPGWGGGTYLHWDYNITHLDGPPSIQGVLYLADTDVDGGGIRLIPRFHTHLQRNPVLAAKLQARRETYPDNAPSGCMDLEEITGFRAVPIAAKAGDLVVWNSLLPHGTGKNQSNEPRRCMFVSMSPVTKMAREAAAQAVELDQGQNDGGIGYDTEAAEVALAARRVYAWRHQLSAAEGSSGDAAEGPPAQNVPPKYYDVQPPAKLTPLGERLLGLTRW